MAKLAIHGGEKVKTTPFGRGKRFGLEEIKELTEALEQQTLFYASGKKTKEFREKFAERYNVKHCVMASSGTAALHIALGAVGVTLGDEVITSPITDMGTIIGILYQNAIPVFADLDLDTYNLDLKSVESKITDKTKAIIAVHLAGNPCDMDPLMELARKHNIKVIEDCAQSYLCEYKGRLAGTIGDVGCFSLNDFKHISAGDGGMVITDDDELAARLALFADKCYYRDGSGRNPSFLAPNYRITELQSAVAIAQLKKLDWICNRRRQIGDAISEGIEDLPGIHIPKITEGGKSSYWFYMFRVDEKLLGVSRNDFAKALTAEGIPAGAGYIPMCVYEYDILKNKNAYEGSHCPFDCPKYGRDIEYNKGLCPNAEEILTTSIRLTCNEFFTDDDVKDIIEGIRKVAEYYLSSNK
jgi:perosamine synthetase